VALFELHTICDRAGRLIVFGKIVRKINYSKARRDDDRITELLIARSRNGGLITRAKMPGVIVDPKSGRSALA